MTTFRLTPDIRRAIRAAADRFYGAGCGLELGKHEAGDTDAFNALCWTGTQQLTDTIRLTSIRAIEAAAQPCTAVLDVFVYDRSGLVGNLYIGIQDGAVIHASDRDINGITAAVAAVTDGAVQYIAQLSDPRRV